MKSVPIPPLWIRNEDVLMFYEKSAEVPIPPLWIRNFLPNDNFSGREVGPHPTLVNYKLRLAPPGSRE